MVLTTRQPSRHFPQLPFGVVRDQSQDTRPLLNGVLLDDLSPLEIARLKSNGFSEPKYLEAGNLSVFTMKDRNEIPSSGFNIYGGRVVFIDRFGVVFVPTFQLVMLMVALYRPFPSIVRRNAHSSMTNVPSQLGLRFNHISGAKAVYSHCKASDFDGAAASNTIKATYTPQSGIVSSEPFQECVQGLKTLAISSLPTSYLENAEIYLTHMWGLPRPLIAGFLFGSFCFYKVLCIILFMVHLLLTTVLLCLGIIKRDQIKPSHYSPQAGFTADNGAAFKGTLPEKKVQKQAALKPLTVEAFDSPPGTTSSTNMGVTSVAPTRDPYRPWKEKKESKPFMGGFGNGIK